MTRKDYILIAGALRNEYEKTTKDFRLGVNCAAQRIANVLAADNPRFDREHFLSVVRGERELNSKPPKRAVESDEQGEYEIPNVGEFSAEEEGE